MTPVQALLISKVNALVEKQKLADVIEHASTKGDLREVFLRDFLVDIFPREYDLISGFLTSHNQSKLSPQVDLIVTDKSKTPKFMLDDDHGVVPFESALLLIEVKTTISRTVHDQLNQQRKFVNDCASPVFYSSKLLNDVKSLGEKTAVQLQSASNEFDKPLVFLAGFNSELSEERLRQLFQLVDGLTGIWLVGQYCLLMERGNVKKYESDESSLYAIQQLLTVVAIMQQQRSLYFLNWEKYLRP